jgi:hypothetical protein
MNDASLQHLASMSERLNSASDALSAQIAKVEVALNQLKLGVWAWVELGRYTEDWKFGGEPRPVTRTESLAYGKHQGKWGLLFTEGYEEFPDPEFGSITFLRDAPRTERIAAVDKLPDLIKALEAKTAELTEQATKKAGEVAALAAAIETVAK